MGSWMDPRKVKTTEAHDRGGVEFPRVDPDPNPADIRGMLCFVHT